MKFWTLLLTTLIAAHASMLLANVPGGIIASATTHVTLATNAGQTTGTMGNGIASIVFTTSGASLSQINYTYNNGSGTVTKKLLLNGKNGGEFYWEFGGYGGSTWTYTDVVDPTSTSGSYGEVAFTSLASGTAAAGDLQVNFSMLKGSPGFYVTLTMKHHSGDIATGLGEMRTNIYIAPDFNWMGVSPTVQREVPLNGASPPTAVASFDSPQECTLWTSGLLAGTYEDKYKFSELFGTERVWGWASISDAAHGVSGGANVAIWNVLASSEFYNGGPLKPELMDAPMVNMTNGGHYYMGSDSNWAANETWTRVQGPYFVYLNNVSNTITDPVQASQALYNDAVAQAAAESTAWPYSWFNNSPYDSNYAQASQRSTVTGQMIISDTGNPNASAANLWVGLIQQPSSPDSVYDFQEWYKPYQFWTKTDANGNFSIPAVISGSNYTLWAFGPGAEGTFLSQNQTGGNPPLLFNLPATPFGVTVTGGTTTNLGSVMWTPTRIGATVFEIGYPDRTGHKFRHGDDWFVGDIGTSATTPSPVWTKFLEYPFDFPNGVTYTVGANQWPTDWNFIQPITVSTTGGNNNSTSTINFTLPSPPVIGGSASLYLGIASDYYTAVVVTINGTNAGSIAGLKATPSTVPTSGYIPSYTNSDTSIREESNAAASDERLTFPATLLHAGTNTITFGMRQIGGTYFADHYIYDYIRLELTGYVPPPPATVSAYPGNSGVLLTWPVTPGATSYNISRSVTSGSAYTSVATGVKGPVCGSGPANATYLDISATNGATYYYVVQSANTTGTSATSAQSTAVTPSSASPATPAAPTGLAATGTTGVVSLTWTPSAGASYYTIQRSTVIDKIPNFNPNPTFSATSTILSTITLSNSVTGSAYTDSAVTKGTQYLYTIQASNAAGTSGTSSPIMAKPVPQTVPVTPVNLTATTGPGQVTLNWPAVSGAVGYLVQVSTTPGGPYTFLSSVSDLTYTQTGLADNMSYYYVITAVNEGGASGVSNQVAVLTPLGAPAGLAATPGNTQVSLNWTPVTGATSYSVERAGVTGGPYTLIGTSSGPSFTNNNLTNGTAYFYVVAAVNSSGTGSFSAEATATPNSSLPVAPLGLTATGSNAQVLLSWSASSGAAAYTVYRASSTGGPYISVSTTVSGTTYTDTGLSGGTTYYYVVAASDAAGTGAYSAEANATTLPSVFTTLTWDHLGTSPTNPSDGAGGWNTTSTLWSTGTADSTWGNTGGYLAVFGNSNGTAGTVTVGNVTAGGLVFSPADTGTYTLTGGTITITGSDCSITTNVAASIGSVLAGSTPVTIQGIGALTLTTPATLSSTVTLNNVTVNLNGPSFSASMLGTATVVLNNSTLANLTGGNNTSAFSNPISVPFNQSGAITFSTRTNWGGATTIPAVTGSGTLNLYIGSNLASSRDWLYTNFSAFAGQVNIIGTISSAGIEYFLTNGATGSATATWDFAPSGTNFILYPQTSSGGNTMSLGALTGGTGATLSGGSGGTVTYSIGGNGNNSNYAGTITGNSALTKVGAGTSVITGPCSYTGATAVNAGVLEITSTLTNTSSLTIASGATFYLASGALSVSGNITNNGIVKLSGTTSLSLTGAFTNNGVLDLINAPASLPPNFTNNGAILTSSNVVAQQATISAAGFTVSIQSYLQHTYQLQHASSLTNPSWSNVSSPQLGTGSLITLSDPTATAPSGFYQILVSP